MRCGELSVHVLISKQRLQQVILQGSSSLVEGVLVCKMTCRSLTGIKNHSTHGPPWCMVDIPDLDHGYSRCFKTDRRVKTAICSSGANFMIKPHSVVSGTDKKNEKAQKPYSSDR